MSRIRELVTEVQRSDFDADTRRMMLNWAKWKLWSPTEEQRTTTSYDLEARGRREATSIELMNGEAVDVDLAIKSLPPELSLVVVEYWLRRGTIRKKLHACRCSSRTFYRRLAFGHMRIRSHISDRRLRRERTEAERATAPANGGQTPLPR